MVAPDVLLRDLRYAVRLLGRAPIFTAAAVLTLAVAIGANTAVFTVVNAVLLEPLPYPSPERLGLVTISIDSPEGRRTDTAQNGRTWELIRDRAGSFERAAFSTWATGVNMLAGSPGREIARHVTQQRVGAGFFRVLGVAPLAGREFTPEEDRPGGPPAAVLSAALWRSAFNADPAVIGQSLMLRGQPCTIVGIMPDGFQSGQRADLWTPLRASRQGEGEGENYAILIRLPRDDAAPQAAAELAALGRELPQPSGSGSAAASLSFESLHHGLTRELRRPLLLLWAAVAIVWLVACVNLAGLLLARSGRRTREIATRLALGSGRRAVVRQLLAESLVLAVPGGILGAALGYAALEGLRYLSRDAFDLWQVVAIDARALAAAALLAVGATVILGLAPALHASGIDVQAGLVHAGTRTVVGGRGHRGRQALVVLQVALGVVMLVAAGLLVRTFAHLRGLEAGFESERLIVATVSLEDARYRTTPAVMRLFDEALARIRRVPGVESAAVSLGVPYQRLLNLGFRSLGAAGPTTGAVTSATYVSGDFLGAYGIPLREGRAFDDRDTFTSPGVAIVNERFARTHYSGTQALGRRIAFAGREREIVGIVGDVQVRPGWGDFGPLAAMPLAFVPASQTSDAMLRLVHGWFSPAFVVRTAPGRHDVTAGIRQAMDEVDPLLPFAEVRAFREIQAAATAPQRFLMGIVAALAVVTLLLAAIGLHGLIATAVTERTREIGIRLALGATLPSAVRTLALPGIRLALAGIALGCLGALAAGRALAHFLWGVPPTDPVTFGAVALLLLAVAATASVAPTVRIVRIDPAQTLRAD